MVLVRFSEEKKEWITINKEEKQEGDLYLDGFLKKQLDSYKIRQKKDFDIGGVIDGEEGSGKSTLASNIMLYMTDCKFDPRKHIIKSHEDAIEVLERTPDGGSVMFDEGYLLFYSADVLTKEQKAITKIFSIIRQKNLFFLIVAPSFFRLGTYFALDRTRFLIRTYHIKGERGYMLVWDSKKKDKLYERGKKVRSYRVVRPSYQGRFTKCSLLDEAYAEIKRRTLKEAFDEAKQIRKKTPTKQDFNIEFRQKHVLRNFNKPIEILAEELGVSPRTIVHDRAELREKHSELIENPKVLEVIKQ